jgi:type I restriction enzyme, S subunit
VKLGWSEAPVSALLEYAIGGAWGKAPGEDEVDVTVIRVADFRDDGTADPASAPTRSVTRKQFEAREMRRGDLLLEKSGGGPTKPVGRVVRVRPGGGRVIPTNFVQLLRPGGAVNSSYLFWWLWWSHLNGSSDAFQRATTNIRNLRTTDYLDRPMPLPPLAEQRRIAGAVEEHLSRLDVADAGVRSAKARLDLLRRSVLDAAVADGRDAALDELLIRIEAGRSSGGPAAPARVDEWGVIKVSAMTWGEFRPGENKRVAAGSADPRHEIRAGDLLVSRANTTEYVGAAVLVRETRPKLVLSDKSLRLIVRDGVDREWLLYALLAPSTRSQISAVATGTSDSMRNISQEKLRGVRLRVPDAQRQRSIAAEINRQVSDITDLAAAADIALQKSAALRRSILARAFRGELVPQDANDEPASVSLERIAPECTASSEATQRRQVRTPA